MVEWQSHLNELRKRLGLILAAIVILFFSLISFANQIYAWLAKPLLKALPAQGQMIATSITAPLLVPIRFVFFLSIFLAIPWMLYQLWAFIAPGLRQQERKLIWFVAIFTSLLFYSGVIFAYYLVFPVLFHFFVSVTPAGVKFMPDISAYLDFIFNLFFAFGCAFEVPVLIVLLTKFNIVSLKALQQKRPYVIVGVFVLSMLIAPPDIFSQTLLAVPMWLLFEIGLLVSNFVSPKGYINVDASN